MASNAPPKLRCETICGKFFFAPAMGSSTASET